MQILKKPGISSNLTPITSKALSTPEPEHSTPAPSTESRRPVIDALLAEPCTDPPEGMLTVGRRGVDSMFIVDDGLMVSKFGRTYIVPMANIRHLKVA